MDASQEPPTQADFKTRIENNLVACVSPFGGMVSKFLPQSNIADLTSTDRVMQILTVYYELLLTDLLGYIQNGAARVFLLLVYTGNLNLIHDFMSHGFLDEHFPIPLDDEQPLASSLIPPETTLLPQHREFFSHLSDKNVLDRLAIKQWIFLAPVFPNQEITRRLDIQRLDTRCPLPFTSSNQSSIGTGGFSVVYRVDVPRRNLGREEDKNLAVAVKKFHELPLYFGKEVKMWQDLLALKNDHLIQPLAAFENENHRCILFPWYEGGNLRDYWKTEREKNKELIDWTLAQMAGLCECLQKLWDINCRHGDLKPENILYAGKGKGFLIADVGLSKIHVEATDVRYKSTSTRSATTRYEAPEFEEPHVKSRDCDTWSMGILLLEWLVWLLGYTEGTNILNKIERFWQVDLGSPKVDTRCEDVMDYMRNQIPKGHSFEHILNLIQKRLLVIRRAKAGESRKDGRAKATELSEKMCEIAKTSNYSREPIPWKMVGDSSLSQQSAPRYPDRYDQVGKRVDDTWRSNLDNDFVHQILNRLHGDLLKAISSKAITPGSCETIDLLFSGFQIPYNVGVKSTSVGRLIRQHSTIIDEASSVRLVSIYRDFDSKVEMLDFAQPGLPLLPKPGSAEQLSFIREWLSNCDQTHQCKLPRSRRNKPEMPMRLLDLGECTQPTISLINTYGQLDFNYVALSHCWGKLPENLRFFTSRENIRHREKGIEFCELPRTFQDAVTVTRGIGIRYLWIDSLCIIQQDEEDWKINAGTMEAVFSSSYCTIAASSTNSCIEGFIHDRIDRPCVRVQKGDKKVYLCKHIDDFHHDVEQAILNTRGWVLQERALSRRTIHFTANQVYLECGDGIQCETLAILHNPKAEFLGDPHFPKFALRYFRDGRIILFQSLYELYSKLAFSVPTDRSMGIIGLERRLAKTFQTRSDYGVFQRYVGRSLIWKRKLAGKLMRIKYPDDRAIPSWSWMAYGGEISYISAPFGRISWNKIQFRSSGRMVTRNQRSIIKVTTVGHIKMGDYRDEISPRLVFDEYDRSASECDILPCVVLGNDKDGDANTRCYYVIIIQRDPQVRLGYPMYNRVGVGSLLERHISVITQEIVWIR
ncbi:hypothetical protein M426DRAFT_10357 [Hypoxylon sp. CI-4A]|nr:hypothetical protein M426DRAFT_10357 [Hypoxylon sp. CI-4A]